MRAVAALPSVIGGPPDLFITQRRYAGRSVRSEWLMPQSLTESSAMLSWRGAVAGGADAGRFLMLLLLDDVRIVPGALSETAFDQQMMKVAQRRYRHAWRADRCHAGADDRIQHPRGDGRDHARHRLDVNKPTGKALLTVLPPDTAPMERVPAVMNLNFLPDMGRMTG
jgi:hypothetical protein